MKRMYICFLRILLIFVFCLSAESVFAQDNSECYDCHSDPEFMTVDENDNEISLYVDNDLYVQTVHGDFYCIDCHTALDGMEGGHDVPVDDVDCAVCHEDVDDIYQTSIHGQLRAIGDKAVPVCADCHGTHTTFPASDSRSMVNKFNLMFTCAACHQNQELTDANIFKKPDAIPQFYESVHAKGLIRDGLIVAPSCNDCHGTHDIQNASNPRSPVYSRNVYKTCGVCHTKVEETYENSVHGQLVESGDRRGPVCTNCHESHSIIAPDQIAFKQHSDEKCGQCHEDMLDRYHETFHGKAMALGSTDVASCYDCHGYHDIVRTENPASYIHPDNKVETCRKCHEGANENFAGYITHANHLDKESNPQLFYVFVFMTMLLVGVFLFFGLHTLLWIIRSAALFLRDSKTFKESKIKVKKGELLYIRFTPIQRFLHAAMIISFTLLALTGIPLKFYYAGWANFLMGMFGGVNNAGYLHRVAALILIGIFVIHVINLTRKFLPKIGKISRGPSGKFSIKAFIAYFFRPESLIPNKRDLADFWNHNKWFFGKGPKPKFDKWTYWEKFDYFAVFWGVLFIGLSGLVMWIPTFFTKFLPGWIINVAMIIHSDEALLAAGFIFTFHFFNVHFRIEKFPMDTVIFSGRISKAELIEEREGWYERLSEAGKLDTITQKDDWAGWQPIMKTFGFVAFGSGVLLAIGIFTAMLFRLLTG
ncbi:cytochrome c3 family protein [candidate division KSB1 bacterium]